MAAMDTDDTPLAAARIGALLAREQLRHERANPESARLAAACAAHWFADATPRLAADSPQAFPLFVREAHGARLVDADGHAYSDFRLGESAALFGHGLDAVAAARAGTGGATASPSPGAVRVGEALARCFALPIWGIAGSARDAKRRVLRGARTATGRPVVLVFDGGCHGVPDDTRVVRFNDTDALAAALGPGDVAAVLCEPALTGAGLVLPAPGFHAALRALTRRHGTLLVLDETHTLCAGPGGYAREYGLEPDALVIGEALAGGVPCAVYGVTAAFAAAVQDAWRRAGRGGTAANAVFSGSALQIAALHATLALAMSEDSFARTRANAERLERGLRAVFERHGLAWCVTRLGARCEIHRAPSPPRDGREAAAAAWPGLSRLVQLYLQNRGILVSARHDMMLSCPATGADDVHALLDALDACLFELTEARAPA